MKELGEFYPKDPDGATPIAYLWARTIQCEGPGCGAKVPLIRSLWLAKKTNRSVALQLVVKDAKDVKVPLGKTRVPAGRQVDCQIIVKQRGGWVNQDDSKTKIEDPKFDGTVKRGSATCPCCGYTTPVARVREQLKTRRGGANDARLMCVVTEHPEETARLYRRPVKRDLEATQRSAMQLERLALTKVNGLSAIPTERISLNEIRRISVPLYGMTTWGDLFTARQSLVTSTMSRLVRELGVNQEIETASLAAAVQTCLAMAVNKLADYNSSLCTWHYHNREKVNHTFARQAIPFVCDFVEVGPFGGGSGNWSSLLDWTLMALSGQAQFGGEAHVECASATEHPLPSDSGQVFITDPPYYDAIPYSHLSDFFYVLFRRSLPGIHGALFVEDQSPKASEIVVDRPHELSNSTHDVAFYENALTKAFVEGRRVVRPDGVGTIVFASKTTASWEAILKAVVEAGWTITGSWPIDTEMETRVAAAGQARLASSVHLVCRPRENPDGSVRTDEVGDWRDVLAELPNRIHEWMPRLAAEAVVGADAIFACLGPALEIFSRYSRVEKASGEAVTLKEYLEQVWAVVSTEALSMIFDDADAAGLEPDARLTAMWLWTLGSGKTPNGQGASDGDDQIDDDDDGDDDDEQGDAKKKPTAKGFSLEFDAARKIAQGLGIHLDRSPSIVEVKGDTARLLPVAERTPYLFGKDTPGASSPARPRRNKQRKLFEELEAIEAITSASGIAGSVTARPKPGQTALDRVHQSMILFGANRGEALKQFLVDDGVGRDGRFWKLAQALSALYPSSTDEKRWVDGVLSRKKSLGF